MLHHPLPEGARGALRDLLDRRGDRCLHPAALGLGLEDAFHRLRWPAPGQEVRAGAVQRDLLPAGGYPGDLGDDPHLVGLRDHFGARQLVRRAVVPLVQQRPHGHGRDVPLVHHGAGGLPVRAAHRSRPHLPGPPQGVGREGVRAQERPLRPRLFDQPLDLAFLITPRHRREVNDTQGPPGDGLDHRPRPLGRGERPQQEHRLHPVERHRGRIGQITRAPAQCQGLGPGFLQQRHDVPADGSGRAGHQDSLHGHNRRDVGRDAQCVVI